MSVVNKDDILAKLKPLIASHLAIDEDEVKLEADLQNDLGADSLDNVEMLMSAEDEFDIEISDEDAEAVHTVQNAVDLIVRKIESGSTNPLKEVE